MASAANLMLDAIPTDSAPLKIAVALALVFAVWLFGRNLGRAMSGRLPPVLPTIPIVGGLLKFMGGPIPLIRDAYAKYGSAFTVNVLHLRMTFLIGPEATTHFFKAPEEALSQKEVYQFNVPTFGPGVVFDVDYPVRMEQFRFFTDALKITRLRGYVDQMVLEAEVWAMKKMMKETRTLHNISGAYF